MAISPMRKGATGPDMDLQFTYDSGQTYDLTGVNQATIFVYFYNNDTQVETLGGGTCTIANTTNGEVMYAFGPNDTAIVGRFDVRPQFTSVAGKIIKPDAQALLIKP